MEPMEILTRHVKDTEFDSLPLEVKNFSKLFIIDLLGVAIAGSSAPGCQAVVEQLKAWQGKEESTVIVYGYKLPSIHAALANSTFAHALDYDDTHNRAGSHTTVPVIPAALAVAEAVGDISGKKFITAVTVGVDIAGRLAVALRGNMHNGWLPASICGGFGSAAAVSKILELGSDEIRNAFGIAYSQASGNRQALLDGAITKRMQPAFAAMQGIYAAHFAKKGISGAQNVITGKYGLPELYSGGQINTKEVTEDLGKRFEITKLTCKIYPCCSSTHPSIDATLRIVKGENVDPSDIDNIEVKVPPVACDLVGSPFQIRNNPQVDAQFSIPYTVAAAITNKSVGLKDFQESVVLGNTTIHELAAKIKVFPDPHFNREDPDSPLAFVRIRCKSGQEFIEKVRVVKGYPEDPLNVEESIKKFRDCVSFAHQKLSHKKTEKLINSLLDLEQIRDMRQVCDYLK